MNKIYQVTLVTQNGKYKPVSVLIRRKPGMDKRAIQIEGIKKICQQRLWTQTDLKKYGYTVLKMRLYDKEKIDKENEERYNKIKEEKYANGEWKRPKGV